MSAPEGASSTVVEEAAALIQAGFALCRIKPGAKSPMGLGWQLRPITDPSQFIVDGREVCLGIVCGLRGIVCVDLDNIDPAVADQELPATAMMDGRPGRERSHRWYRVTGYDAAGSDWPDDVLPRGETGKAMRSGLLPRFGRSRNFADRPGSTGTRRGVELKASGTQAVVPPSHHKSGCRRQWHNGVRGEPASVTYVELREACMRLAEKATSWRRPAPRSTAPVSPEVLAGVDVQTRQRRAAGYLDKMGPAIEGKGGHAHTWNACCLGGDFALTPDDYWPVLSEWNETCSPPWNGDELWTKLQDAYEDRDGAVGCKLAERVAPTVETTTPESAGRAQQDAPTWTAAQSGADRASRRGPQVVLPSVGRDDENVTLNDCATGLFGELGRKRVLFCRGSVVHELRESEGGPALSATRPTELVGLTQRHVDLCVWRQLKKDVPALRPAAMMPETVAAALLVSPEARELLPPVEAVLAQPGLVEDGGRLRTLRPGYNSEGGGILVTGGAVIPEVDHRDAIEQLKWLLVDFRFATPGDKARAFAALLTPALRMARLINGHVPAVFIEADASQTGKGFFATLVAAIYGESQSIVAQRSGGVGSLDESLCQRLIEGRPFIQFDNLRGRIDSQLLEALLTPQGHFAARVPHRGEVAVDPTRFLFTFTSNGVTMTPDMANRVSIVRLRKQDAGYSFNKWPAEGGQLLSFVRENQARLLGCIHSVVQSWWASGRKRERDTGEHSFREWAGILGWIVGRWFGTGPLLDGHAQVQQRVADPGRVWLREVALAIAKRRGPVVPQWSALRLAELCQEEGIAIPGAKPDADDMAQAKTIGLAMRRLFCDGTRVEVDGMQVERVSGKDTEGRERPEYRFNPAPGSPGSATTSKKSEEIF